VTSRTNTLATRLPFVLAVLAVLGARAWQIFRSREPDPIFEGHRLDYWLGRCPYTESFTARAAVREAGTNAIPMLLRFMRAHNSAFKRKLIALAEKQNFMASPFVSDDDHWRVVNGFEALGPDGRSAVPELLRIYQEDSSPDSRIFIIMALSNIGPTVPETIPLLISETANSNSHMRAQVILDLGRMGVQPELVVPVLLKSLSDPDRGVKWYAVQSLGDFGPQAKAAVPLLIELRQSLTGNRDLWLRERIDKTLQKIDPIAAANAVIQTTNASPASMK
jgi:HEAT repeat protein